MNAQSNCKSRTSAEETIKKTYDPLTAAGLKGIPDILRDTGERYLKIFRDTSGAVALSIFWTPGTGAYELHGAIIQTYGLNDDILLWHVLYKIYQVQHSKCN